MNPFERFTGAIVPLDRSNVDTDQIVPKQFLKLVTRANFGNYLFYDWRFDSSGTPKPDFALNQKRYSCASILLARSNFGCGSSREHAAWAISDYGFRSIIASSFADIFYNNCFKNGILPIIASTDVVSELFRLTFSDEKYLLTVNLEEQIVTGPNEYSFKFDVEAFLKKRLLEGLDDVALTLAHEDLISAYEKSVNLYVPS